VARADAPPPAATQALTALTPREMEVFRLVARAMSNAEIAETLVVSEATVKTHVAGILARAGWLRGAVGEGDHVQLEITISTSWRASSAIAEPSARSPR
jgi:DNA-binding CsgD family transcriptional regulator